MQKRIGKISWALYFASLAVQTGTAFGAGPNDFRIVGIQSAGTGCTAGSVATDVSSDHLAFTVLFDSYRVETIGSSAGQPSNRPEEAIKSCTSRLQMAVSPGWTYTLPAVDMRGYARLEAGSSASQRLYFGFLGAASEPMAWRDIVGPFDDDFSHRSELPPERRAWSPCTTHTPSNLDLMSMALISSRGGSRGLLTVDSTDGDYAQVFTVRWLPCAESPLLAKERVTVYRLFNLQSGAHFLTSNTVEYSNLRRSQGWRDEGIAFSIVGRQIDPSLRELVRLRNPNNGFHYYTSDGGEIGALVSRGYIREVSLGYIFPPGMAGTRTIYRLYNQTSGAHLFTTNEAEVNLLTSGANARWQKHSDLGGTIN